MSDQFMGVPLETVLNPGSLDDPVSACKSSDGSTEREDAVSLAETPALCLIDGRECNWVEGVDWMGDPSIPDGTVWWTVYRCRKCGDER